MTVHKAHRAIAFCGTLLLLSGCAANTLYQGVPVASMSDEQLIAELQSAVQGYGVQLDRTTYLMAIRPEPAYVLTSSTTTVVGSTRANYNAYVMPTGYGASVYGSTSGTVTGTAATRYQYTDVNGAARLGNAIATAISHSRQEAYRARGMEVLEEYRRRVITRRQETERTIETFFMQNPELQNRRLLVAAVAPWAASQGPGTAAVTLQKTKEIITAMPRGLGLSGAWYGTFSQTSTAPSGEFVSFGEFVRLTLQQRGDTLTGRGVLGSGENIELTGTVRNQDVSAAVANTTSAINVRMTAIAAQNQITGAFNGFGAGVRMEGTFTLLR